MALCCTGATKHQEYRHHTAYNLQMTLHKMHSPPTALKASLQLRQESGEVGSGVRVSHVARQGLLAPLGVVIDGQQRPEAGRERL